MSKGPVHSFGWKSTTALLILLAQGFLAGCFENEPRVTIPTRSAGPPLWDDQDLSQFSLDVDRVALLLDPSTGRASPATTDDWHRAKNWVDRGYRFEDANGTWLRDVGLNTTYGPFDGDFLGANRTHVFMTEWDRTTETSAIWRHDIARGNGSLVWQPPWAHDVGGGDLAETGSHLAFTTNDVHLSAPFPFVELLDLTQNRTVRVGHGSLPRFAGQELLFVSGDQVHAYDVAKEEQRVVLQANKFYAFGPVQRDSLGRLVAHINERENVVMGVHGWRGDHVASRLWRENTLLVELEQWVVYSYHLMDDERLMVVVGPPLHPAARSPPAQSAETVLTAQT